MKIKKEDYYVMYKYLLYLGFIILLIQSVENILIQSISFTINIILNNNYAFFKINIKSL